MIGEWNTSPRIARAAFRQYALEEAIATFRARQHDALAEWAVCTDPDTARYLRARADQAGCEAAAMEASVAQWRAE